MAYLNVGVHTKDIPKNPWIKGFHKGVRVCAKSGGPWLSKVVWISTTSGEILVNAVQSRERNVHTWGTSLEQRPIDRPARGSLQSQDRAQRWRVGSVHQGTG